MILESKSYRKIALIALCALSAIVVTGAAVRLTGSGLGCPDWPKCNGDKFVAASEYHSLIEFTNRALSGLVALAVVAAAVGSLWVRPLRKDLIFLSLGLVAGVIAQIVLGGLTVWYDLNPFLVMSHFLLSMVLIFNAMVLVHRAGQTPANTTHTPISIPADISIPTDMTSPRSVTPRSQRLMARAMLVVAAAILLAGTVVTGAGPHSGDEHVERLGVSPELVTRAHTSLVWLFGALTVTLLWRLKAYSLRVTATASSSDAVVATPTKVPLLALAKGKVVLGLFFAQGTIGYLQFYSGVPALLVGLHVIGAVAFWISVIRFNLAFFE